jgi:hypothetical protein
MCNRFQIIGVAISAPDYEERSIEVRFGDVYGNVVFGNRTVFPSNRAIKRGDSIIIEGRIAAVSDGMGELYPIADTVCVL